MGFTNSPLVNYTRISPNKTSPRNHNIDTITIHCYVGQASVESMGDWFSKNTTKASSNYGIDADGRIGMFVEEKDKSWCSSSSSNDNRAVTIEVASDTFHPYKVNDVVYKSLVGLVADICKRNNIKELKWKGDKSMIGQVSQQNMTVHRWFANKACPGDYLYNLHGQIAKEVNAKLNNSMNDIESSSNIFYKVQVGAYSLKANADAQLERVKKSGFETCMVQTDGVYKVQVGAFSKKENAEKMLAKLKIAGYDGFITINTTNATNTNSTAITKEEYELVAKEVLQGKWGNGDDRKKKLQAAGYDYYEVQKMVNKMC